MPDIRALINKLAAEEAALRETCFLAPCVPGLQVRVRVSGLVYSFRPVPAGFEGWGIFQPRDAATAELLDEATLAQVGAYLKLSKALRVRLATRLRGRTWLAYPANEADARQQTGRVEPVLVRLVDEARQFEQVVARHDGALHWFEATDTRADPREAERLHEFLRERVPPAGVNWKGITPETRTTYALAANHAPEFAAERQRQREETRLRGALALGGGTLQDYADQGDHWLVNWRTGDGELHTSTITKHDLTVLSAGICLSGQDRAFDLQSLVGVVEGQWE
ncbi:MAG: hypothetical protein DMF64_22170 [Acidobacteria bacterium]|nr:MAG: hypothetical protein DMF64_22170 [Acidobacteriota bacterium]